MSNKGVNGGRKNHSPLEAPLGPVQAEVLRLLGPPNFLTPAEIARERKVSPAAISKVMTKLRMKGVLSKGLIPFMPSQCTLPDGINLKELKIVNRLHAEEFNVQKIQPSKKYLELKQTGVNPEVDGNTIRLYSRSLEVYSHKWFFGKDTNEADRQSVAYWNRFFRRLETELKISIIKPNSYNIRRVKAHYAEINNELAKQCIREDNKVRILASEDGETWCLIDDSPDEYGKGMKEIETTKSETSKEDMQDVLTPHFNSLRDYYHQTGEHLPTPEQTFRMIVELKDLGETSLKQGIQTSKKLEYYAENMVSHVKAVQTLSDGVHELVNVVKEIKEERKNGM